jgi:hypothetical protein
MVKRKRWTRLFSFVWEGYRIPRRDRGEDKSVGTYRKTVLLQIKDIAASLSKRQVFKC